MSRLGPRVLLLAMLAIVVTPATVHADAAGPTDYRSEVIAITPATPVVSASVEGGDSFVRITVEDGHEVVVLGYDDEPYVRIDVDGVVHRNVRSYATYYNEDRYGDVEIPDVVDNEAEPSWERVGDGGTWAWHDHRTHLMTERPPIGLEPGDAVPTEPVPLVVDGTPVTIEVRTVLQPEPSPWPALFGVLIGLQVGLVALLLGPASGVLATLVLAVAATIVGAAQYWSLPAETGPLVTWWLLPVLAAVAMIAAIATWGWSDLLRDGLRALAALQLGIWAFRRRDVLTGAVLPTDLAFWFDRMTTTAVLVGSVVLLVATGRDLLRQQLPTPTAAA